LLYLRALSPFVIAPTYAVLKKSEHPQTDKFHQAYWRLRKTTLISIDKHESLLPVLRQIQHGIAATGECPPWIHFAVTALTHHNPFDDRWQAEPGRSFASSETSSRNKSRLRTKRSSTSRSFA
jgi:hypothetical protein